jgi:hypothetical protein
MNTCSTNVYGLKQAGYSCWFDSVIFALTYPVRSRRLFMNIMKSYVEGLSTLGLYQIYIYVQCECKYIYYTFQY